MTVTDLRSTCLNAPVHVAGGNEGTCWYECDACGEACDLRLQPAATPTVPHPLMDCPLCGKFREHGHTCTTTLDTAPPGR